MLLTIQAIYKGSLHRAKCNVQINRGITQEGNNSPTFIGNRGRHRSCISEPFSQVLTAGPTCTCSDADQSNTLLWIFIVNYVYNYA